MLNTSVFEFPTGRCIFSEDQLLSFDVVDDLPEVPALPETLLAMELQLRERTIDLQAISAVVLSDLGATIQVLRLAGREYGNAEERPIRIEDCISDLGLQACLDAVAGGAFVKAARHRRVLEFWTHAREIAENLRAIAEESPILINPDQAYLAGLLHAIGELPSVLAWPQDALAAGRFSNALKLAEQWCFPAFLKDLFRELAAPGHNPRWTSLLDEAHRLAMGSWTECPLTGVPVQSLA